MIRALRFHIGMTQQEFGALFETDKSTVCDWEAGKHVPFRMRCRQMENLAKDSGFWTIIRPPEVANDDDDD